YSDIIGFDKVIYDRIGTFEDLSEGKERFRRVLLTTSSRFRGPFSNLYGPGYIELVQSLDRVPRKIYEGRFWGDPGFIQICFDVKDMKELANYLAPEGYKFTVDSCPDGEIFDMGEASGHFTYIEDPDGTLIEFVQTHRVPLYKKIYLDLDKRSKDKPFPKVLFRIMALGKIDKLVK
ncbi:MAG: VOC family protein, partial [Bacteroidales bacterium]|nr:VOC family protein [Bacteroidales bacterium]